jgi:uncharacterized protein
MEFDKFSIVLLIQRPDAPKLDEESANKLQDAHMDFLAKLHEQGHLLAAGPLSDKEFRGLTIMRGDPEKVAALKEQDPAVKAGKFMIKVIPWMVPTGAMAFSRTRFPHSIADAMAP